MRSDLLLLIAAMRAFDAVHADEYCDDCGAEWPREWGPECRWCATRRRLRAEAVLRPPAPRGYGYVRRQDDARYGIDREADREADLREWARDLEMAVAAEVVTQEQMWEAWNRATQSTAPANVIGPGAVAAARGPIRQKGAA